jgi:serine/threonine protein kinase
MQQTIEQLLQDGKLAEAHARFGEFLRQCEFEMNDLALSTGRLSHYEKQVDAGVNNDSFERNKIAMNFQGQINKFRRETLGKYFDIRTQQEFFDSISDRDTVIHQILDYRLMPKNYKREAQLVEGNSSIVYQLVNPVMKRHAVALVLKVPTLREEARYEIARLTDLRHRNVMKVIDHDLSSFPYFVITEYVYGSTLPKALDINGPRPVTQAIDWLYQLTDALDYLRHKRIIHTNMRPSKIYVDDEWQVMISPFDLGQFSSAEQTYNRYVDVCQYGSPELVKCDGIGLNLQEMCVSDEYSLGLLAYKILTGKDLFEGDTIFEILTSRQRFAYDKKYREQKFAELPDADLESATRKKLSLNVIIRKLLEENPKDRYPDLHKVLRALHPLTRADQKGVSVARQCYRRCLSVNKEFINDFYRAFIQRELVKDDMPITFIKEFSDIGIKRQSAMLQMAIDLMIDVDKCGATLTKILKNENHQKYGFSDFDLFISVLIEQLKENDPKWDDAVAQEWNRIKKEILILIQ